MENFQLCFCSVKQMSSAFTNVLLFYGKYFGWLHLINIYLSSFSYQHWSSPFPAKCWWNSTMFMLSLHLELLLILLVWECASACVAVDNYVNEIDVNKLARCFYSAQRSADRNTETGSSAVSGSLIVPKDIKVWRFFFFQL